MAYFPFFVELEGKKCLIAGGGMVAYRKALVLKDFGPEITVVAVEMIPEMEQLASQCEKTMTLIKRGFEDRDIQEADFVIAATSDEELNRHISVFCRRRKIPVNVVDVQEECSFIFPALIKEEDIVVGISTGGSSPTIAQYLKKRFKEAIPSGFGMLASQLGTYRELVKEKVPSLPVRTEIFKTMVKEGIRQGGVFTREQAIELIERKLGEHEQ
ncbi:precorrin-2 dehydrogenase/sirohydrochlorin ferrochelatase family protein [Lacrimispora sp. 38-1]|uniref:precorrin-2 dehydrogenase/sirohydrochlorin ferrochelatase family protein n=1 Tax=Lacrimispora sp. 38-1 TaxID=3125778 RepID=UPI003CFA9901